MQDEFVVSGGPPNLTRKRADAVRVRRAAKAYPVVVRNGSSSPLFWPTAETSALLSLRDDSTSEVSQV